MNIYEKLKELGYDTLPETYYKAVGIWKSWYESNVKSFHQYRIYNGQKYVKCKRYTLGMAKRVAEDWAGLLLNEKVHITLEGEKEQAFFDQICKTNVFEVKGNEAQELKSATGAAAYVFRVTGMDVAPDGEITAGQQIKIDYLSAENIFPLSWENGKVLDCAFTSEKIHAGKEYLYLRIDYRDENGLYIIENYLFENRRGSLTSAIPLATVPELATVPPVIHTGSNRPQFIIDKLNIINNLDPNYPLGIPAFANALDELAGTDIAYDSYVNEFNLGKKRIMVKPEALKDPMTGEPYFDTNDVVFYVLPEDGNNESVVKEIDMNLRTEEHSKGIQDMLNLLSSKCGLGPKFYKFEDGNITTATQVITENSELFRNVKKHEIILNEVLINFAQLILYLGNVYLHAGLNEEVEISIDFDDSIVEDKGTEFEKDARMVSMGIMNAYEFRMKWMNEDEATAKAALPKVESLVNDPNE